MIRIKKLKRPNKRSGHPLTTQQETKVRGIVIVNTNAFTVYVDKFTDKPKGKRRARSRE